jgi:hypothetical protein
MPDAGVAQTGHQLTMIFQLDVAQAEKTLVMGNA